MLALHWGGPLPTRLLRTNDTTLMSPLPTHTFFLPNSIVLQRNHKLVSCVIGPLLKALVLSPKVRTLGHQIVICVAMRFGQLDVQKSCWPIHHESSP
jgi:hypothetical protein